MDQDIEFKTPPRHALLIVIAGTAGAGKDTVIQELKERNVPFHFVITATSRDPRPGEVPGLHYFFFPPEEFEARIQNGEFLEHAMVYGQYKGIPKAQVKQALDSGLDVIMRLDVQGAARIRSLYPEAVLIFLMPPNESELVQRLVGRKTEDAEKLKLRIDTATEEIERIGEFDYYVINRNDYLDEAVDTIEAIIRAEHQRVHHRKVSL